MVNGTAGDDDIYSSTSNVTINGGGGNDYVNIGEEFWGDDVDLENISIKTGAGDDTVFNNSKNATISTGAGNDSIGNHGGRHDGVNKNTLIDAGDGDDTIDNHGGNNVTIVAGAGNDSVYNGNDDYASILGGDGDDTIQSFGNSVTIDGGAGNDNISNNNAEDNNHNVSIAGGAGNDTIRNDSGENVTINGGAGNDSIINTGTNVLFTYAAGDGNDIVEGFNENSTLQITGGTYSTQTIGSDVIVTVGNGKITLKNAASLSEININDKTDVNPLITLTEEADNYTNTLEGATILALGGDDTINSDESNVSIDGDSGNDYIRVDNWDAENISITGGDGDDTVFNISKNSTVSTGAGNDSVANASDALNDLGDGDDYIEINNGSNVTVIGSAGDDTIRLNNRSSKVLINYATGDGNDLITGFRENSTLQITSGTVDKATSNGTSLFLAVGENTISLEGDFARKTPNIIDQNGNAIDLGVIEVVGTDGNDNINNQILNASIDAGAGDDTIHNNALNVTINACAGNDSIGNHGGHQNGNDLIDAGDGNDTIDNHVHDVTLHGGKGNDYIVTGDRATIYGDEGDDTIFGDINNGDHITINGGAGNDSILVYMSNHVIEYNAGDGNDTVTGFDETDTLSISGGDYETQESGTDIIVTVGEGSIKLVDATKLSALHINDEVIAQNNVLGTTGNDKITVESNGARVHTYAGKDTIQNTYNNVLIDTGDGNDSINNTGASVTVDSGKDNDIIRNKGTNVSIVGGAGNDTIENSGASVTVEGGKGNDSVTNSGANVLFVYSAGDGNDVINGFNATSSISISGGDYSSQASGKDVIIKVGTETVNLKGAASLASVNIIGSVSDNLILNDTANSPMTLGAGVTTADASARKKAINITGNELDNSIVGGKANDTINGAAGNDTLTGGAGKDIFVYSAGNDVITDYTTSDKIISDSVLAYNGFAIDGNDVIFGFGDDNSLTVKDGKDVAINLNNVAQVYTTNAILNGGKTATTLLSASTGFDATNTLYSALVTIDGTAATGAINVVGNAKANKIFAGANGSTLSGGAGNDNLIGGAGNDSLSGGAGKDIFFYSKGADTIADYEVADKISLNGSTFSEVAANGSNIVLTFGEGDSLTINDGKDKKVTFQDGKVATAYIFEDKTIFNSGKTAATLTPSSTGLDATNYTALLTIDGSAATNAINLVGNAKNNKLFAGKGGSTLSGGAGNDVLTGGDGADIFVYTAGKDVAENYTSANDTISLGSGVSVASFAANKTGDLVFTIGKGNLTLKKVGDEKLSDGKAVTITDANGTTTKTYYADRTVTDNAVTLNASFTGTYTADSEIVSIDASPVTKAITVNGNDKANVLTGGKSNDTLNGGKGNDTLTGGAGKNMFVHSAGNDVITDYTTADKISLGAAISEVSISGNNVVLGFGEGDSLTINDGKDKKITLQDGKIATAYIFEDKTIFNSGKTAATLTSTTTGFDASTSVYSALVTIDGSAATAQMYLSTRRAKMSSKITRRLTIQSASARAQVL